MQFFLLTISRVIEQPKNILVKQEVLFFILSTHHYYVLLLFLCLSFVFKGKGRLSSVVDDQDDDGYEQLHVSRRTRLY